jgi:hypothetical protein
VSKQLAPSDPCDDPGVGSRHGSLSRVTAARQSTVTLRFDAGMLPTMRGVGGLGLGLLLLLVTTTVHAQKADYDRLIREALMEFEHARWPEAYALFSQAHQISPNARTLRGLGVVSYELGEYPEALQHLQAALESRVKPLSPKLRTQVQELLERARRLVGTLEVQVTPAGAQVLVGRRALEQHETQVPVGKVTVRAEKSGYAPAERVVTIRGGRRHTLRLKLIPVGAPGPSTAAAQPGTAAMVSPQPGADADPDGSVWSSPWLWTGVGLVVVGGVVLGLVVAGSSQGDDQEGFPQGNVGVAFSALTGN